MNRLFFLLVLLPNLFGKHQQGYVSVNCRKNIDANFSVLTCGKDGFLQEEVLLENLPKLLDFNLFQLPSNVRNQNVLNTWYEYAFDKKLSYNNATHFLSNINQANQFLGFPNNQLLGNTSTVIISFKKNVPFLINDA